MLGVGETTIRRFERECKFLLRFFQKTKTSKHHAVVEVGPEVILVRVNDRWLRFTASDMERDDCGKLHFALQEDGTVQYADVTEEMDHAAERLAREMFAVS